MNKRKDLNKSIKIALLVSIAVVLMYFDFPIVPIFPWLKIDFSEVPALIGGFAYGPIVGGVIVVLKVILRLLLKGSVTFGIGEVANILVGIALVMPSAWLYNRNKSKKSAIVGMVVGALIMQLVGIISNIYFLIPAYGIEVDLTKYVLIGLVPFNGIKALIVCIGTFILYKRLSIPIFNIDSKLGKSRTAV
ncbi:MAG: ECF transporter S component [Clostridium sp.]|nr:ECF transporter S component [Clostridium sp.]